MSRLDETRAILRDLIAFPTVSADPNVEITVYLADRLSALGAHVELVTDRTGHKASLFARLGPEVAGGLLLSGHTDVVPVTDQAWSSDPFTLREEDGLLYGRGTCDMKGFVAACLAHAGSVDPDDLETPLYFAFTYDEEVGCLGARQLVDHLKGRALLPRLAVIGEPTEMRVIEGHKGCCEYTTVFSGLEGHGSAPDLGVNAIEFATRYAAKLLELREELKARAPTSCPFDPPWTTINLGRLSGGTVHNIIANHAELDWEMRPVQVEDEAYVKATLTSFAETELLPAMRAIHPGATIETTVIGEVAGLEPDKGNRTRDILLELTGANRAETVPFGTEAGLFQSLGMETVVCGPGSIEQAHKADEFISLSQLQACLDLLDRLVPRATRSA
ncbi:acetylornithine deacetylase [Maritalea mobilis]|uniref:acetylornithine deacetylase n=1 Tax=Maritalea mobilis TaxID=483324 RepID=UPI001C94EBC1|nr:acetylornithine deacetylase [Maritalea mobilis]MBY6202578.1 acetylornithine deacetylase [Maritalea mobilis]